MLRKTMIALLAAASVAILAPGAASARGGGGGHGGGGGGGFHGGGGFGGGGGFHGGGFGGGGLRAGGMGGGAFSSSAIAGGGVRSAAIGSPGMAAIGRSGVRSGPMAANAYAPRSGVAFAGRGFRGRDGGFRHGRGFALGAFGAGLYGPYGYDDYYNYPDYAYDDSYTDEGGCYVVQRRVHTRHGWRLQPVQVCG
jgi:hypothetical protein